MSALRNRALVLFTAIFLIACSGSSGPEKVAGNEMNSILNNNMDGLIKTIYFGEGVPEVQEDMVRGKLNMVVEESSATAKSLNGVKKISYSETEYNQDKNRAKISLYRAV